MDYKPNKCLKLENEAFDLMLFLKNKNILIRDMKFLVKEGTQINLCEKCFQIHKMDNFFYT